MMPIKLFGTDGIRGIANHEPMTVETITKVGKVTARYFKNKNKNIQFIIGRDTRISGEMIENAFSAGVMSSGLNIIKLGVTSTPSVAFLSKIIPNSIGAVISASHNPYEDNGLKLFSNNGYKLDEESEREIEYLISKDKAANSICGSNYFAGHIKQHKNILKLYFNYLSKIVSGNSFADYKVVLDCANGANYAVAPLIFTKKNAKIIPINCDPDGKNINLKCGALYPESMADVVLRTKANIGFSYDGDGDRVIMSDEKGKIVNGDQILAIYANYHNKYKKNKIKTIIGTIMSNIGLELYLKRNNIEFIRSKVGDKYVLDEMIKRKSILGGEQSGHIIFLEKSVTGDGLLTSLIILSIMQETKSTLSQLASCFISSPQILINIKVREKKRLEDMPKVKECIENAKKVLSEKGRINFRYSGTENLARIMIEGLNEKKLLELSKPIVDSIKKEIA